MNQPSNSKLFPQEPFKFESRPDIDGLRAISVIIVIVHHLPANLNYFPQYGSIAVQVFFVISGYLITSVILRDITRNRFTLQGFYERRIKRILPNLMLCTIVNFIIAYSFTRHNLINELSSQALGSLLMINNFRSSYLEGHFWTLAIEQHFYLVWPLVVPFLLRRSFKNTILILIIASLVSFVLLVLRMNVYKEFLRQSATFYWVWSLAMGCMLALIQYERQKQQSEASRLTQNYELSQVSTNSIQQTKKDKQSQALSQHFANAITIIAFITIILVAMFGIPFLAPWEGIQYCLSKLIAALAAYIIIDFKGPYLSWILSLRFLRFIGRQSYSLYVWHYSYIRFICDLGVADWLKGFLLIFPLGCCYFQDKITNSKKRKTVQSIISIYLLAVAVMVTLNLNSSQ